MLSFDQWTSPQTAFSFFFPVFGMFASLVLICLMRWPAKHGAQVMLTFPGALFLLPYPGCESRCTQVPQFKATVPFIRLRNSMSPSSNSGLKILDRPGGVTFFCFRAVKLGQLTRIMVFVPLVSMSGRPLNLDVNWLRLEFLIVFSPCEVMVLRI